MAISVEYHAPKTTARVDKMIEDLATRILYFHREGIAKRHRTVSHWHRMHHAYDRLVDAIGKDEALIQWHGILAYHKFRDFEPRDTSRLFGTQKPEHRYIPWEYDTTGHDPLTWSDPFQGDWVDVQEDEYDGTDVIALMEDDESIPYADNPMAIPTQAEVDAEFQAWAKAGYPKDSKPLTRRRRVAIANFRWLKDQSVYYQLYRNLEESWEIYDLPHAYVDQLHEDMMQEIEALAYDKPVTGEHYRDMLTPEMQEKLKGYHKILYTHFKGELDTDRPVELSLEEHYREYKRPLGKLTLRVRGEPEMERAYTDGITATDTMQVFKQMSADTFYAYFRARHEEMRITADLKDLLDTHLPTIDTRIRNLCLAYWHDLHHGTDYMMQVINLYRVRLEDEHVFDTVTRLAMEATMVEPTPSDHLIAGAFEKEMRFMKSRKVGLYREVRALPQQDALRA